MDTNILPILAAIVALMFIANSSMGKAKSPNSIKNLKASQTWGIKFFDDAKWLKWILISILKIIFVIIFGLWRLIASGVRLGTPNFVKKIQKGF